MPNKTWKCQITDDVNHPRRKQVDALLDVFDQVRINYYGGYPTEWIICRDTLIMAEEDDQGVPRLTILPVDQWLLGKRIESINRI